MTGNKKAKSNSVEATISKRMSKLEAENELLLLQLRQTQEELSIYYSKYKSLEKTSKNSPNPSMPSVVNVSDEVIEAISEIPRLTVLVESQKWQQNIVLDNSLKAKLGELLIQSVTSVSNFVLLPFRLIKIWYAAQSQYLPSFLGGDKFEKVIEEFQKGGFDATERLLAQVTSSEVKGRAYTSLARYLMQAKQLSQAAQSAKRAYCADPQPYRLKWLAFRLFEAGEAIEAEAYLSLLPNDVPFSDSEVRHRDQLIKESKRRRTNDIKTRYGLNFLSKANRNRQSKNVSEQQIDIDTHSQSEINDLKMSFEKSQKEVTVLTNLQKRLQKQIDEQTDIIRTQNEKFKILEDEKLKLVKQNKANKKIIFDQNISIEHTNSLTLQIESQLTEIESLKRNLSSIEEEKKTVVDELKKYEIKSSELLKSIMVHKQQISQLELDNMILIEERENFERVNSEHRAVVESLKQSISLLKAQVGLHSKK